MTPTLVVFAVTVAIGFGALVVIAGLLVVRGWMEQSRG